MNDGSAVDIDQPGVPSTPELKRPLTEGELVLLVDQKNRRYVIKLEAGGDFQTHAGSLHHHLIIGQSEGHSLSSTRGQKFTVYRPTLSDFIMTMPRGAQVIYPKDIGPMLLMADIGPGVKVFESGVGSGALSMAMLRAGAHITGYELRDDFASRARNNVSMFLGDEALDRYEIHLRDSYEGIEHGGFDRVVLDIPEPWRVIPHVPSVLGAGGLLVSYSPSITQVMKVSEALKQAGFSDISTTEVLNRGWHVDGQAVRPDHRMVAHTGFLTRARLLST
ncbi:MAG: tRNA (adenine-N1)-methyltransferase [Acidimicrobiia bacterium]|nr:tRNA (adenine-N1)-methyltransferase [Acidimicrobiia bacterium]